MDGLDLRGRRKGPAHFIGDRPIDDDVTQCQQMWEQLAEWLRQAVVQDDDRVLGVVGDVDDLFREEPDVQRMQDSAHGGHSQIGNKVLGVVPHEGGHALVAIDTQAPQGVGELSRPGAHLGK